MIEIKEEICGKQGPIGWVPIPVCVLPKGHKIIVRYTAKLKKRRIIKGHMTDDGRRWPIGNSNLEFE